MLIPEEQAGTEDLSAQDAEDLAVVLELARADQAGKRIDMTLGPFAAWLIISGLQLASRHPNPTDVVKEQWRQICDQMAERFPDNARELIGRGWDASYDVPC